MDRWLRRNHDLKRSLRIAATSVSSLDAREFNDVTRSTSEL
jgi:hypothetical protein